MNIDILQAFELDKPIQLYCISVYYEDSYKLLYKTEEDGIRYGLTSKLNEDTLLFDSEEEARGYIAKNAHIMRDLPKVENFYVQLFQLTVEGAVLGSINLYEQKMISSISSKLTKEELAFFQNKFKG